MKNPDGTMVEADVEVNGAKLDFAQSMTLRVAVSSFLMCCNDDEALGKIGPLYAERCREILKLIHEDIKQQGAPRLTSDMIDTHREVERLEACLRYIGANCEDAETVRDLVSRTLRGKSVP